MRPDSREVSLTALVTGFQDRLGWDDEVRVSFRIPATLSRVVKSLAGSDQSAVRQLFRDFESTSANRNDLSALISQ
jgi:hypothetical protein